MRRVCNTPRSLQLSVKRFTTSRQCVQQHVATEKCPEPTCPCAATPPFPAGVEPVDTTSQLAGTVAIHNRLIVIGTGALSGDLWPSKIENDGKGVGAGIIKKLKSEMGVKGQYFNSYWNGMVVASSFNASDAPQSSTTQQTTTALVLPQSVHVSSLSSNLTSAFIEDLVLPNSEELQRSLGRRRLDAEALSQLPLRDSSASAPQDFQKQDIRGIIVFICGHGQRDGRCGALGPVLKQEFEHHLVRSGLELSDEPVVDDQNTSASTSGNPRATVGLISHIGGHKFAGNVIVHFPPSLQHNRLAGKTIWYGRVEPKHVEGIVDRTIHNGVVIKELLRGGMDETGLMLNIGDYTTDS